MIIYGTKQTVDRYGIKMPEEFQEPVMRQIILDVYNHEKDNLFLSGEQSYFTLTAVNVSRFVILQANLLLYLWI